MRINSFFLASRLVAVSAFEKNLKMIRKKFFEIVFNNPILIKTSPFLIGICQDRRILSMI